MKAGRELDALIAEKVFEEEVVYIGGHPHLTEGEGNYLGGDCPHFSTQIADAWLVVEKLKNTNYNFGINIQTIIDLDGGLHDAWGCYFCDDDMDYETEEDTAPLAICLAALKAVE